MDNLLCSRSVPRKAECDSYVLRHEKRLLLKLADRLRDVITPDQFTAIGFLGALGVGGCYWLSQYNSFFLLICCFMWVVNWFGDSMDGTMARFLNQERPRYGYYVDHCVDMLSALVICVGLGLSGYVSFSIAICILAVYYLVAVYALIESAVTDTMDVNIIGFDPTSVRAVGICLNVFLYYYGSSVVLTRFVPLALIGVSVVMLVSHFIRRVIVFRREEVPSSSGDIALSVNEQEG